MIFRGEHLKESTEIAANHSVSSRSGRGGRRFESSHSDHTFLDFRRRKAQVGAQVGARSGRSIPNLEPYARHCFEAHFDKGEPHECWVWRRATANGYGRFKTKGKVYGAHRVAYAIAKGDILPGYVVMHSCDNRMCCNPDHLKLATQRANVQDMIAKGRANWQG